MFTGQNLVKMHLCSVDHWCDINLKALCYWWEYRVDCSRVIHSKYCEYLTLFKNGSLFQFYSQDFFHFSLFINNGENLNMKEKFWGYPKFCVYKKVPGIGILHLLNWINFMEIDKKSVMELQFFMNFAQELLSYFELGYNWHICSTKSHHSLLLQEVLGLKKSFHKI